MVQDSDFRLRSGVGEEHIWLVTSRRKPKAPKKMTTKGNNELELNIDIFMHFY